MLFDSGFILFRPPLVSHFQLVRGRADASSVRLSARWLATSWDMVELERPRGVPMACIGGRPTIAKMGTVASLATNSLVETASTGAIENIRRETPICWERNGVLAAGTG